MLAEALKTLLSTSYAFVIKAQYFHWNVEGPNFPQYHEFFGNIYEEVYDNSIDQTAEYIRTLDSYTPGSMTRFAELSIIQEQTMIPRAELMLQELEQDNMKVIELLNHCFEHAEAENKQGIADYIAGRLDAHEKHGWMLRSTLKKTRA
jgi:starvation-inducible DNA-binding protein